MRLISIAFLFCGLLAGLIVAQEGQPELKVQKIKVLTDLDEATVTANEMKKPVFVYVFDSI